MSALGERAFWLPRERLVFQNEAPLTGYVLEASEDHLIILNDRPRIVIEKPKATLQDRDLCYPEDHKARPPRLQAIRQSAHRVKAVTLGAPVATPYRVGGGIRRWQ